MFSDCVKLKEVTIPSKITKIEKNAFFECKKLSLVKYNSSMKKWKKIKVEGNNTYLKKAKIKTGGK